jgi:cytidine deaminase
MEPVVQEIHKHLLEAAKSIAPRAYAPHSGYRVGAAVLAGDDVFLGANVENAVANLGVCAERVALANAMVHGAGPVRGVAVWCLDAGAEAGAGGPPVKATLPCGGCRQWLAELAPDAWVATNGADRVFTLDELLPLAFRLPARARRGP